MLITQAVTYERNGQMPKRKITSETREYRFDSKDTKSVVKVWCEGRDYDSYSESYRPVYSYQIKTSEWSYVSNDIRGGANEKPNLNAAVQSLFAFLYQCCTCDDSSEDRGMFPEHVRLWGDEFTEEFSILSIEAAQSSTPTPSSVSNDESLEELFGSDDDN